MKNFLLVLFVLFSNFTLYAQSTGCAKFRDGKFKSEMNDIIAIIERKGSRQYEYAIRGKDTLTAAFTVKWLDDCTYTLTPDSQMLGKHPKFPKEAIITVKMSKATATSYFQTETANFLTQSFTSEMILLPEK